MPLERYSEDMNGTACAYSRLPEVLTERHSTVADLLKRLTKKGATFDKKTLYRLASHQPIHSLTIPVVKAVCDELKLGLNELISWDPPQVQLHRIDDKMQARLSALMVKNNEGSLTSDEKRELEDLGAQAERLSLANARILAGIRTGKRPVPARKSA